MNKLKNIEIIPKVLIAVAISSVLFMIFPTLNYMQNRSRFRQNVSQNRQIKIETITLKKKEEKKKKEIKKNREQPQPQRQEQKPLDSRFKLNLAVEGFGDGIAGLADTDGIVYEQGQTDIDAQPLSTPSAEYPSEAYRNGLEATVSLRILVGQNGTVEKIDFLSGEQRYNFKENAMRAVSRWKFSPALLKNIPVRQWYIVEYEFSLD